MEILYKNKRVEKDFCSKFKSKWKYPPRVKEKLEATENYLKNATNLSDVVQYPPFHFHGMEGTRKGEWSIYLGNTGYRVTMIPCDDAGVAITHGDIIAQCKQIRVVQVTEVSNHYE